ncbi:hypothetical protein GcM3_063022, partial [Golovinomyces cichoracearum]
NHSKYQSSLIPTLKYRLEDGEEVLATSFSEKCDALIHCLFPAKEVNAEVSMFSTPNLPHENPPQLSNQAPFHPSLASSRTEEQ